MKNILVDTCIWSLALRGKSTKNQPITDELTALVYADRAKIAGPIRQEVLSGYSNLNQYNKLKDKLDYFPDEAVIDIDYICAAEFYNQCRQKGIQGSHIDFLICALAYRLKMDIFTVDKDFIYYAKHIPVVLYPLPS
ncbi:MAG: putative nucleic acid-binding protein [Phenylobacterium sp.]|jgi:predicted nucleic acid-binding protein